MSPDQYRVLQVLDDGKGRTIRQIANELDVWSSLVKVVVRGLEDAGMVTRRGAGAGTTYHSLVEL